ncbi:hypothetical protein [Microbacterium sp. UNCCL10]|uniref:hypothetical protein n=1 Tax=Microbacterium sp. UNCCL10 TaxID=1449058 RepID=UPI000491AF4A|nr:hypothetical protein [Microbacterium sp. UNCCL10]
MLAIGVGALSVLALQSTATSAPIGSARSAPTFDFGDRASGTPTPSATVPPAATADAAERFLAIDGSDVWRATSGVCGGAAPVVEYSSDGGDSWVDVTPDSAVQVVALATLGSRASEVVAATDATCAPTVLRTYTAGNAWQSYPQMLGATTFVSPQDRSSVTAASTALSAPCAEARSARTSRSVTGIVCDGSAFVWSNDEWTTLAPDAVALDAVAGTIVVAHVSDECEAGVTVTQFTEVEGAELGCISDVDAAALTDVAAPAALSLLGEDLVFWSGDSVFGLD